MHAYTYVHTNYSERFWHNLDYNEDYAILEIGEYRSVPTVSIFLSHEQLGELANYLLFMIEDHEVAEMNKQREQEDAA